MNFVLDNSVTMRWFFGDGKPAELRYAGLVLDSLNKASAVVPVTWGLKVANVIARAEAKAIVTEARSRTFLELLEGINIEVDQASRTRGMVKKAARPAKAKPMPMPAAATYKVASRSWVPDRGDIIWIDCNPQVGCNCAGGSGFKLATSGFNYLPLVLSKDLIRRSLSSQAQPHNSSKAQIRQD